MGRVLLGARRAPWTVGAPAAPRLRLVGTGAAAAGPPTPTGADGTPVATTPPPAPLSFLDRTLPVVGLGFVAGALPGAVVGLLGGATLVGAAAGAVSVATVVFLAAGLAESFKGSLTG